jgi:hypothetical protein
MFAHRRLWNHSLWAKLLATQHRRSVRFHWRCTVLVREWDRQSHRVMVLAEGFAWNGQTYDSLTKVAFAITGTHWNGPRFFGLRDKQAKPVLEGRR